MKPTDNRADQIGQIDDLSLDRSSRELSGQGLSGQELSELNALLERITDSSTINFGKANDSADSLDSPLDQSYAAFGALLSEVVPVKPFCWKGPAEMAPALYESEKKRIFPSGRVRAIVSALAVLFLVTGWAAWRLSDSDSMFQGSDPLTVVGVNNSPSVDDLLTEVSVLDDDQQDMADWDQDIQDSYWGDSFEEQLDSIEYVMTSVQTNGDSDSLFKQAYWDGIDFQEMDEF